MAFLDMGDDNAPEMQVVSDKRKAFSDGVSENANGTCYSGSSPKPLSQSSGASGPSLNWEIR